MPVLHIDRSNLVNIADGVHPLRIRNEHVGFGTELAFTAGE
jgi:hypothetical protein